MATSWAMGYGVFAGWLRPDLYPTDDTHLSYGEALALNSSRYFNADQTFTENTQPTVSVLTSSGVTDPVDGQLAVHFTASDASGLTAALLYADGNLAAELPLSGTSTDQVLRTPYFTAGTPATYEVFVYDTQGNRTLSPGTVITVAPSSDLRPSRSFGWATRRWRWDRR